MKLPLNLKWRRGKNLPFRIWGYPKVVVFNGKVYTGGGVTSSDREQQTVIVYDPEVDSYDTLPTYTFKYFSMAVNNQLVVVGGVDVQTYKMTNELGVWNEQSKRWSHSLPPMATACHSPSVATHNDRWLLVMGGKSDGSCLSRVEILDTTEQRQWYQSASLPHPLSYALPATIGNKLFLLGGFTEERASTKVLTACVDDIISEVVSRPGCASGLW